MKLSSLRVALTEVSRNRSISKTLTILLSVTIIMVSAITVSVIYSIMSQKRYVQLEEKADTFILSLDGSLEIPLWNMDSRNVEKIGNAFTNNELFVTLKVFDNMGNVFYDFSRNQEVATISRSSDILHEGQIIGHVEIALTTELIAKQNRQVLLSGLGVLLVTILAITVATSIFFRGLLNRLFSRMEEIADAYASGTNNLSEHNMPFFEFQPLIRILSRMRDRLKIQFAELQETEKKYRGIFENAVEGIFQSTPGGRYISANPSLARMLGYDSPEELIGSVSDIGRQLFSDPERRLELIRRLSDGENVSDFQARLYTKNRDIAWMSIHARPIPSNTGEVLYFEGMALDITHQKNAEEEHRKLQQQLLHAQRMDSIGRLAGGVAHDFNNMLSIILGYSDMLLEDISPADPIYNKVLEVQKAAQRSSDLTRQLLAFARKQTISPKVLNLNDTVTSMLKMLQRLLGEEIDLVWIPGPDLFPVKIDPSQIDQILANLCVNARDALQGSGKIIIETMNAALDETYCRNHLYASPGDYVMLTVSDNGCGMDKNTQNQIFEPFFTTKDRGKGTGLGLATVYGIVKQNNGNVAVYSELEQGTTFKIYLPSHSGVSSDTAEEGGRESRMNGNETVLLVEDEKMLLSMDKTLLKKMGYNVLATSSPDEAIRIAGEHEGDIHLLLTDVVMPGMNGRDLSNQLVSIRPGIKCLFMSGYMANVIAHQGVLDEGVHFIQKPFTKAQLAISIRTALDE